MSHEEGSQEAILRTQRGFVHLLQRTDADYLGVDPTRTSLTGTGGTLKVGKHGGKPNKSGGVYKFETGFTWRSPTVELNDIGFLQASDEINHFTWVGYSVKKPFSIFNTAQINYNHWGRWDFGGKLLYAETHMNTNFWLKNNWRVGAGANYNQMEISNNALRGTTALRKPPGYGYDLSFESDSRKKITFEANLSKVGAFEKAVKFLSLNAGIQYQPINAVRLSIIPGYRRIKRKQDQFVANVGYNGTTTIHS